MLLPGAGHGLEESSTPRIRQATADGYELAVPPTAIFIAADPEEKYATPEDRAKLVRKLKEEIRGDVERQDAAIGDDVLDLLVHVEVWGDSCYELANFTDEELVEAAAVVVAKRSASPVDDAWCEDLRRDLAAARVGRSVLDAVLGPRRVRKTGLADALWPTLKAKLDAETDAGTFTTPVLRIVGQAIDAAAHIPRGSVWLDRSG